MSPEVQKVAGLKNVILSSGPCPICRSAAASPAKTLAEWRASSMGDTDSKKRYCNLKAHNCHCILVPTDLLDELPEIGEQIKLRGDEGTDIRPTVDIHPNEIRLKNLMEEYNARIGKLPKKIYTMDIDDVIKYLDDLLKKVPPPGGKLKFHKNVTQTERKIIESWSESEYMSIRDYLRAGEIERENLLRRYGAGLKERAELMERLFEKYIDGVSERTLYRGLGRISDEVYNKFKSYKVGDIATIDKVISSWSTNPLVAGDFADTMGNNIRFYLEKGRTTTLELDIKMLSAKTKEAEVILNTHKFKITRIREEVYAPVPELKENILHVYLKELD